MKWFHYGPIPEEEMKKGSRHLTLCEVLRVIYRKTEDEETRHLIKVAMSMAKSMSWRITQFDGPAWGEDQFLLWEETPYLKYRK